MEKTATIKLVVCSRKWYHDSEMFIKIFTMLSIQPKHNYRDVKRELIEATVAKRDEKNIVSFFIVCVLLYSCHEFLR